MMTIMTSCIEAVGTDINGTYKRATITIAGRQWHFLQHRVAWEQANGRTVPDGLVVMHLCDNPACVNPKHLRIGTRGDNNRDKTEKGRDHNSKKTHCPRGHAYDYIRTDGARGCRECMRAAYRRYNKKRRIVRYEQRV